MELRLSTATLKQLTSTMPNSDVRYYLNGIHAQEDADGNQRIQVTDGIRLNVLDRGPFDSNKVIESGIIPAQIIKHVLVGARKRDTHPISLNDGVVHARNGELKLELGCIEGKYPQTGSIIGAQREKKQQISLDSLKDIISKIKRKNIYGLVIRFYDAGVDDGGFTIEVCKEERAEIGGINESRVAQQGVILYRRAFNKESPFGQHLAFQLTYLMDLFKNTDRAWVAVNVPDGADAATLFTNKHDHVRTYIGPCRTPDHWRDSSEIYVENN